MAQRVAFLIGNQTFRPDSGLSLLQGPANDVASLALLLRNPERGRFEVHEFLDKTRNEVLPDLEEALGSATSGDLFLIYYSGHGKLDRSGRLCLATADTRQGALLATSVPARHLRDLVEESDCDQVVLLLDCCYSGAVEDGLRGDVGSELHVVENARGFYIMTASTGLQSARETETVPGGVVMGRFTAALVSGIESGAADLGRSGKILLSDLRRHLGQAVTGQTPQFFARKASGDPVISLSPPTAPTLLDAGVLADLDAEQSHRRHGAVSALAGVLRTSYAAAQVEARAALQRRWDQERDPYVRTELEAVLALKDIEKSSAAEAASLHTKMAVCPAPGKAIPSASADAVVSQVAAEQIVAGTKKRSKTEQGVAESVFEAQQIMFRDKKEFCRNGIDEALHWGDEEAWVYQSANSSKERHFNTTRAWLLVIAATLIPLIGGFYVVKRSNANRTQVEITKQK